MEARGLLPGATHRARLDSREKPQLHRLGDLSTPERQRAELVLCLVVLDRRGAPHPLAAALIPLQAPVLERRVPVLFNELPEQPFRR